MLITDCTKNKDTDMSKRQSGECIVDYDAPIIQSKKFKENTNDNY